MPQVCVPWFADYFITSSGNISIVQASHQALLISVSLGRCIWVSMYLRTSLSRNFLQPKRKELILECHINCTHDHLPLTIWASHEHKRFEHTYTAVCSCLAEAKHAFTFTIFASNQALEDLVLGYAHCITSCLKQGRVEHHSWECKKAAVLGLDEYPEFPTAASDDAHVWVQVQYIKAGCSLLPGWFKKLW